MPDAAARVGSESPLRQAQPDLRSTIRDCTPPTPRNPGGIDLLTPADLLAALALPTETAVGTRVPKRHLDEALRDGAAPAALRRAVADGVAELTWAASLKPATAGVPAFRDDTRTVTEVQVFTLARRPGFPAAGRRADALAEAVHRAVKYPLLLVTGPHPDDPPTAPVLTLAELRDSRAEKDAVVLDGPVLRCDLAELPDDVRATLRDRLSLVRADRTSLLTLYRGWVAAVTDALAAAKTGGPVAPAADPARRRSLLEELDRLDRDLAAAVQAAKRAVQMADRVAANARVRRLREARQRVTTTLAGAPP